MALLAFLAGQPALAPAQNALPEPVARRIDSVFAMYTGSLSPGCALGVIREGRTVFERGYGMSDLQHGVPITPASIFHVASISKQFAAMSIVLLAHEGRLGLDDDIRTHLPELPDIGTVITIRHLIHHTSGLRDQWQLLSLGGWRADDPKSEADILWLVGRQRALNFPPGAEHLYSNTGYTLLGAIVHRVSGRTLREFTTERIFGPLGMTNTHFHDDHTMIVPGRTSAYVPRAGAGGRGGGGRGRAGAAAPSVDDYRISIPVFDNAGATSLFTTVQDMAKWERNFLQPTVGDGQVLAQMLQRGRLGNGSEIPYGFALTHGQYRGLRTVGHSGADAGYRADYLRFPDQRHAFVTLCNIGTANPGQLNRDVAAIVLGDQMAAPAPLPVAAAAPGQAEAPIDAAALRRFAGLYLDTATESMLEVTFRDSTRSLHGGSAPNAPRLHHAGNNEFVVPGPAGAAARAAFSPNSVTLRETAAGNTRTTTFERVNPPVLTPARLGGIAGRYRSEELDVEWTIRADGDSALFLERRRVPVQRLQPRYEDGFTANVGSMRFTRDAAGRIDGFLLTSGRIRHVRFEKAGG